jgi:hypothetical protein
LLGGIEEVVVPVDFLDVVIVRGAKEHRVAAGEILDPVDAGFRERGRNVNSLWIGKVVNRDSLGVDAGAWPVLNTAVAEVVVDLAASAVPNATGIIYVDALGIEGPIIPKSELAYLKITVAAAVAPPPANTFIGIRDEGSRHIPSGVKRRDSGI